MPFQRTPIYFTKLVLENIRSFSARQELSLINDVGQPVRWTLIVGDNGVGKTTILQCLARMRPMLNQDENGSLHGKGKIEPELVREEENEVLNALVRSTREEQATVEAELKAELSFGSLLEEGSTPNEQYISTGLSITRSNGDLVRVKEKGKLSTNNIEQFEEPLVLAYGAGRHPKTEEDSKAIDDDPTDSLFKVEASLLDAEKLLYQLEFAVLNEDQQAKNLLDSVKRMLARILPDLDNPEDIKISGPPLAGLSNSTGIRVRTSTGIVPFGQLSLGYQTILAWTVDIAWKLIKHYPESETPLEEPAIIIVDEIDLHLHPSWQREIREHLTKHFPNTQFIATAHSPLMAQCALDSNLAVLQNPDDHSVIVNDPEIIQGWRLDQVITSDLFGLASARSPEVEKSLERRYTLLEKQKNSELSNLEKQELDGLNQKADELPTAESSEDQSAMDMIRSFAADLKSRNEDS